MFFLAKLIHGETLPPEIVKQLIPILEEIKKVIEPHKLFFEETHKNIGRYYWETYAKIPAVPYPLEQIRSKSEPKYFAYTLLFENENVSPKHYVTILKKVNRILKQKEIGQKDILNLMLLMNKNWLARQIEAEEILVGTYKRKNIPGDARDREKKELYNNEILFIRNVRSPLARTLEYLLEKLEVLVGKKKVHGPYR
ncbi:MAG: hypothetical protein AABY40_00730 [Nanoarchaeota archaeon]